MPSSTIPRSNTQQLFLKVLQFNPSLDTPGFEPVYECSVILSAREGASAFRPRGSTSAKDDTASSLENFSEDDWKKLYDLAVENEVFPAFYDKLLRLELKKVPDAILSKFREAYFFNMHRNIVLERELTCILNYLGKNNISVITLKGPVLAKFLYGDVALRQASCDLDLLVGSSQMLFAKKLLEGLGYKYYHRRDPDFFYKFQGQVALTKKNALHTFTIDLHCNFLDRFVPFDVSELWLDSRKIELEGCLATIPSCESLLLYLTLCAVSSSDFFSMKYLYDIHRLVIVSGENLLWEDVAIKAKKINFSLALFFVLNLSGKLFRTPLPAAATTALKCPPIKWHLLKPWINQHNVLNRKKRIVKSYTWRYIASSYLYSRNLLDCVRVMYKKAFLPMEQVMGMSNQPLSKKSYGLYLRRLINPLYRLPARNKQKR